MRLLVTGAGGQLGGDVAAAARRAGHSVTAATHAECDIEDAASVTQALRSARPDALVNCAGWTDVDGAERDPAAAFAANADGPRTLAVACAERNVLLLHLSTDYVFAGDASRPMAEDHAAQPLSAYGRSKLAGERAVRQNAPRHQIVRTAWLYGRDGPNFALTILRRGAAGEPLRVVDDQQGTPTWTGHLAPALLRLAERATPGTYHLTNGGATTWHGFAVEVLRAAGMRANVEAMSSAELQRPARRPAYAVLENAAWRHLGEAPLPEWREGVRAYVEELRTRGALPR